MTKRGYNVNADAHDFNVGKLIAHVERCKEPPPWMLFKNNLSAAKQYHTRFPQTQIIYRAWPDDSAPQDYGYKPWLDNRIAGIGDNDFWIYLNNESGASDHVFDWSTNIITLNSKPGYGRKLLVGGFSGGTPEFTTWFRSPARRMLEAAHAYRSNVVVHLHCYGAAHMMSSSTTNPDIASWPDPIPDDTNLYHIGRFRFLKRACQQMNIPMPRIGITEFGFDDMSDLKPWLETLPKTPPYPNIRGWRSLVNYWRQVYPQWSAERAYYENARYVERVPYSDPAIEFFLYFCLWDSGGWDAFRLDNSAEFLALQEQHMTTPIVIEPAPPVVALPPDGRSIFKRPAGKISNLRSTSAVDISNDIGDVKDGDEIEFHGQTEPTAAFTWIYIQHIPSAQMGWLALYADMTFEAVTAPPVEPPTAPLTLFTLDEQLALLAIWKQREELKIQETAIYAAAVSRRAA